MLKIIRQSLALIVFICFIALIADYTGTLHAYLGWMARMQLVPALLAMNVAVVLLLILLTLLMGRIYCSVICPLGIMQDIISHFHIRLRKNRFTYSPAHPILRIGFLILFVALLVIGLTSWAALLAPYSIFTRITTTLVQPLVQMGGNMLAWWSERANNYMFYSVEVWMKSLTAVLISATMLIILIILAWRGGRTYCNTVCPVGTVLGYLSKFALFRLTINTDKCVSCGVCSRKCKASCIDGKHHAIDYSRCVTCFDCIGACTHDAISYRFRFPLPAKAPHTEPKTATGVNSGRRTFLSLTVLTAVTAAIEAQEKKVDGGLAVIEDKKAPEPPLNFKATVEPNGRIHLSWSPAPQDRGDIAFYEVAAANDSTHEFMIISPQQMRDTTFTDSVAVDVNQKYIYYRVRATDYASNIGRYTAMLQVERPHLLPPTPAHLDTLVVDTAGIHLCWIVGADKAIILHNVYRRLEGQADWELIASYEADQMAANDYRMCVDDNPPFNNQRRYEYVVESFNSTGISSGPSLVVSAMNDRNTAVDVTLKLIGRYDAKAGRTRLSWDCHGQQPEGERYWGVYVRKPGSDTFEYLISEDLNDLMHSDRVLSAGESADYYVVLLYSDGRSSNPSNIVTVTAPTKQ